MSALAAMKMLKHSLAGVKKGRAKGGMPIEVMGLLIGKPEGETIVVLDAAPIPVEGIEYKVSEMFLLLACAPKFDVRRCMM